jgi:glycosyltransferase involved in cell wall biosynthesis
MQGGVGDYTHQLGCALGALGVDVHVLTHTDAGGDHLRTWSAAFEPTVHPLIERYGWQVWRHTPHLVKELRPDIVHIQYQPAAYGLHGAINLLPWRLRLSGRRPHILTTFHDLRVPYLFPKAGPLRWRAVLVLASASDLCVVTNPADWLRLSDAGVISRLRAIPIGSNIACQPPADYDRSRQRARWGVGPDDWLLAYFGFLNASKGGETLIRALAELVQAGRPAKLLMVGGQVGSSDPTNRAYLARIEGLIGELGLTGRVQWTGFVTDREVSANLLAADCAVLPYREGASLRHGSLMAALAHGLPIISTQVPEEVRRAGPERQVFPLPQDGVSALLVPPDDPVQLAAAVAAAMTDPHLRACLAQAALNLSHQFTWDTIARRHLEAYRELV